MNIQISSNRKLVNVNYDNLVQGKITIPEISIELFLSHCTKEKFDDNKLDPQHNCVKRLSEILINHHKLRTFFDRNDIKSNPGNIINDALDRSRILVAICTPEYIAQFMKQRNSWPSLELGPFIIWEVNSSKDRIIPVLLDISREEFQKQGCGIPTLIRKRIIEIPSEYRSDENIIVNKANEIALIHSEYFQQWG